MLIFIEKGVSILWQIQLSSSLLYEYISFFGDLSRSFASVRVSKISPLVFNYILIGTTLFFFNPFPMIFPVFSLKLPPNMSLMLFYISCPFLAFYSSANCLSLLLISRINLISSYSEQPESPCIPSLHILLGRLNVVPKNCFNGSKANLVEVRVVEKSIYTRVFFNYNNYNKLLKIRQVSFAKLAVTHCVTNWRRREFFHFTGSPSRQHYSISRSFKRNKSRRACMKDSSRHVASHIFRFTIGSQSMFNQTSTTS